MTEHPNYYAEPDDDAERAAEQEAYDAYAWEQADKYSDAAQEADA